MQAILILQEMRKILIGVDERVTKSLIRLFCFCKTTSFSWFCVGIATVQVFVNGLLTENLRHSAHMFVLRQKVSHKGSKTTLK